MAGTLGPGHYGHRKKTHIISNSLPTQVRTPLVQALFGGIPNINIYRLRLWTNNIDQTLRFVLLNKALRFCLHAFKLQRCLLEAVVPQSARHAQSRAIRNPCSNPDFFFSHAVGNGRAQQCVIRRLV